MKTKIISIPPVAAAESLKFLHAKNINCQYIGIDQSGRILMQVSFSEEESKIIDEVTDYMEKSHQFVTELTNTINEILRNKFEEADKIMKEYKRKQATRELKMSLLNHEH